MCHVKRVMQKTQSGGLFLAVVLGASTIAALNFITMHTFAEAQNTTSGKNTTVVGNMTASSSSCGTHSTASSCYDAGYQNALANPGYSYNYCWMGTCPRETITFR